MARGLTVYRAADVVTVPPNDWRVREGAESLYDEPLGSESTVSEFWSKPASALGLTLLAEVYEHGFHHGIRWSGEQLLAVVAEVGQLEVYWRAAGLTPETLADLDRRAGFVRAAVAVAVGCNGAVVIT